ncbi:perilipin-3-like [Dromaius novaehollandiae]|uniref:perilipin-3-like n=1 Tax=Dromaius novaehollandiae TaxID=8790 RepID=UPI00311D3576
MGVKSPSNLPQSSPMFAQKKASASTQHTVGGPCAEQGISNFAVKMYFVQEMHQSLQMLQEVVLALEANFDDLTAVRKVITAELTSSSRNLYHFASDCKMSHETQPLAAASGTPKENHVAAVSSESKEKEEQNTAGLGEELQLLKSSYDIVSSAPAPSEETHPSVRSKHGAAEAEVKTLARSAAAVAQPVLTRLETEIATVKEYVYLGQEKLEDKLPNLQEPDDKVLSGTKEMVSLSMTGAEDAAIRVAELEAAREVVQRVLESARSLVTSQDMAVDCRAREVTDRSVEAVPGKSGHYFPITEEELADLVVSVEGTEGTAVHQQLDHQGCFVQLTSLPTHLHQKAYQCFLAKVRQIKMVMQETFSQLQYVIELIDCVKQGIDQKLQKGQEKLHQMWLTWNKKQPKEREDATSLELKRLEVQILAMSCDITQQLQHTLQTLLANIQGFPSSIQDKMQQVQQELQETHNSFQAAASFQDLSRNILTQKHHLMNTAQECMDELLEYVEHNIPLAWLVGPFTPSSGASVGSQEGTKEKEDEENKPSDT